MDSMEYVNDEDMNEDDVQNQSQMEHQSFDSQGNLKVKEEDKPWVAQNPLKLEVLKKGLSKISKTYNGLSYAYTCLELKEKELDELGEELSNYIHLRDINISNNKFVHIKPLEHIPYLVRLDASKNEIKDIDIFQDPEKLQFLQILKLDENKIKFLPEMNCKNVLEINLENNQIETAINFTGLPNLLKLNLKQNKLKNCEGIANMPALKTLYLSENELQSFRGMENLPNLRKLRLKNNKFSVFDCISELPNLEKLNFSENQIKDFKQFAQLRFPNMKKIIVDSNPCFEDANAGAKIEILIQLEHFDLTHINKEEVLKEDREESQKVKEERIQKDKEEAEEREKLRIIEEQEKKEREEQEERERKEKEAQEELEKKEREEQEEKERREREEQERNQENDEMDKNQMNEDDLNMGDEMDFVDDDA